MRSAIVGLLIVITVLIGVLVKKPKAEHVYHGIEYWPTVEEIQDFAGVVPDGKLGPTTTAAYRMARNIWLFETFAEEIKTLDQSTD